MRFRFAVLLLLFACDPAPREAPERVAAPASAPCVDAWARVADGIEYRFLGCALHLVRVDLDAAELGAVIAPDGTAAGVARSGGWAAAMNANFFDEEYQPLGLVIQGGRQLHAIQPVSWESIFAVTRDRRAHIVLPADWPPLAKSAQVALQAGPRLVVDGKRIDVLPSHPDARSGICIEPKGRVVLFATAPETQLDVHQIGELAARPAEAGGLGCREAMLFDGGPSTQLFVARPEGVVSVEGDKRVPTFITARQRPVNH